MCPGPYNWGRVTTDRDIVNMWCYEKFVVPRGLNQVYKQKRKQINKQRNKRRNKKYNYAN